MISREIFDPSSPLLNNPVLFGYLLKQNFSLNTIKRHDIIFINYSVIVVFVSYKIQLSCHKMIFETALKKNAFTCD